MKKSLFKNMPFTFAFMIFFGGGISNSAGAFTRLQAIYPMLKAGLKAGVNAVKCAPDRYSLWADRTQKARTKISRVCGIAGVGGVVVSLAGFSLPSDHRFRKASDVTFIASLPVLFCAPLMVAPVTTMVVSSGIVGTAVLGIRREERIQRVRDSINRERLEDYERREREKENRRNGLSDR